MKKEKLFLKQAQLFCEGNIELQFSLRVFEQDCFSIVCEDLETRNALTDMFRGICAIFGGAIYINGRQEKAESFLKLCQKKVAVIGQRKKLIRALSIPENICLFSDVKKWNYNRNFLEKSNELAKDFCVKIDFSKSVDEINDKESVIIELLKAYIEKREIIVFTGISRFLNKPELEEIHRIINQMRSLKQQVSFVLIESLCDIVYDWSDRIQILKDGMDFGSFNTAFLNRQKLYEFYSGHSSEEQLANREKVGEFEDDGEGFEFREVSTGSLSNVSFRILAGEFLNIFCLDTISLEGIYRSISGMDALTEGKICFEGKKIRLKDLKSMRRQRICYCKTRAYDTMLIPDLTVRENILLDLSKKISNPYIQKKYEKSVDRFIEQELGEGISGQKVWKLSVLNRQKLVFLKIYMEVPRVLICEQPFFDSDIRLLEVTREALKGLADRGIAIILLTMDLDTLNCFEGDSIYLSCGRLVDEDEIYHAIYQI